MNSATTQPPLHDSPQGLSLRFCCVVPPSPAPCPCFFCFRAILIFFFRYGRVQARNGFLLEGETGGIHSVVILIFVVLKMDSVLRNYIFLGILIFAKPRLNFPPAERGLGNECGRVLRSDFWRMQLIYVTMQLSNSLINLV